jgi:hypothetical protein
MNKFFQTCKKNFYIYIAIFLLILFLIFSINKALFFGILFDSFLTAILFSSLYYFGVRDKKAYVLFLIVFLIHFSAVLFICYTGFRPASGGADYEGYNQNAIEMARRFSVGNFNLEGLYTNHYFPALIGVIYTITIPNMIVGQMFVAWLAAFSVLMAYLIMIEIGGSKISAFLIGLIISAYPSYLYFGSLLLKDNVVIPLVLSGLLLSIKIFKKFNIFKFLIFFALLTGAMHLRFYIGFALMGSFIICWFLLSNFDIKKKIVYGIFIILFLGFSPQLLGYGYYGTKPLKVYLNKDVITKYREVVYAPNSNIRQEVSSQQEDSSQPNSQNAKISQVAVEEKASSGSSFVVEAGFENPFKFIKNYFLSFVYSLFGPFPWQLSQKRHILFLADTIPWYIFFVIIIYGIYKNFKIYKYALPLVGFSLMALGALSLYINNFGIISRIRMPIFISLLCVMVLSFDILFKNKKLFFK